MINQDTRTIRISEKIHDTLTVFCKFKKTTIKEYISDRVLKDDSFLQFEKELKRMMFK